MIRIQVENLLSSCRIKLPPENPSFSPGYRLTIAPQESYEVVTVPGDTWRSTIRLTGRITEGDALSIARMLARECIDSMLVSFVKHDFGGVSQVSVLTVWPWSEDATLGAVRRLPVERLCQVFASEDLPKLWRETAAKSPLLNG